MSRNSRGEDSTLLETILMPFFSKKDDSSELDLKKYLSDEDEYFTMEAEDGPKVEESKPEGFPMEVLFSRDGSLTDGHDDAQSLTTFRSSKSIDNASTFQSFEKSKEIKRCPFFQTRNNNYRTFMEEAMLIKCCSKKILQCLEDTKLVLEKHIEIKNVPGFGRVQLTQAWVWIFKEAIMASFLTARSDKKLKKSLDSFIRQLLSRMERVFKQLIVDTNTVIRTYSKLWKEFETLMEHAFQRFSNNIQSSLDYEIETSGYNFFFHRKGSTDSLAESAREVVLEPAVTSQNPDPILATNGQSLQVRCSIDGVTLRTGRKGSFWLKFQKIDQEKDIQLLLNLFLIKMTAFCTHVRKSMSLVNELLEVQKRSSQENGGFRDSVLQSILNCQGIVNRPKSEVNFFPKEEVIMLYTLKTTKAAFDLIQPLLTEFALITDSQFSVVREFTKQRKQLKSGKIANRFPLDLNAGFELIIEDTKVDIGTILNRYPNLRDARQLHDMLLQKYSDTGSMFELDWGVNDDVPAEIIYKCPSQLFFAQSTQEIIEMFRKIISQQRDILNPNPAHFLITDIEQQYIEVTKELMTSRTITPEMLYLCGDPVKHFYQAAKELSSHKDKMLTQVVFATQKLTYTQSGLHIEDQNLTQMSSWIQAICKIMHVWRFHSLPKHLQTHFLVENEETMKWIVKLEGVFRELTKLVKHYKEELQKFHDFIEINHGFITWVRKVFTFNPPSEIISKWAEESQKDEDVTDNEEIQAPQSNPNKDLRLQLHFHDFDMSLVELNPEDESSETLVLLNKISGNAQIGLVTILFNYINQVVSSAIVNLNTAAAIHEKHIGLKSLKNAISPDNKLSCIRHVHQLEDLVLAITFEMTRKGFKETVAYVGLLNNAISQLNQLFQTVQLHLQDRGILEGNTSDSSSRSDKRKKTKKKSIAEMDHLNHDKYLNETMQLLKSSLQSMPNVFDIQAEELKTSFMTWVKLADKDAKLMATVTPIHDDNSNDSNYQNGNEEDVDEEGSFGKINFEEAMMLTTTGKAFFPNPEQFSGNIESWRDICFKMLSAALDKFREVTSTKINDTKSVLSCSHLTQISVNNEHSSQVAPVGYTEGLCSLLFLSANQLSSRDHDFVSNSDISLLKSKFSQAASVVIEFKKRLDKTEKVLVNSLSLSLSSVEQKRLLHYLPVLPLEHDFLKNHDLDEIASMSSSTTQNDINVESNSTREKEIDGCKSNLETEERSTKTNNDVAIRWDSSNKHQVLCKTFKNKTTDWLQFSQLHIHGQLRIINVLIDQVIIEFEKATKLVKEAKEDLMCAKKLLERTWKGLGKDMEKRRITGSGVIVLLKLYRHQVTTAAVNIKAIRKNTEEVKYLLSQSTRSVSIWINGKDGDEEDLGLNNYLMNMHGVSVNVTLKPPPTKQVVWLWKDDEKLAEEKEDITGTGTTLKFLSGTGSKEIFEIKEATQVKSSASLLNSKGADWWSDDIASSGGQVDENASRITHATIIREKSLHGFLAVAPSIQQLILGELTQASTILKQPNCSDLVHLSSREDMHEVPNVLGVITALIAITVDIRFFKEILPQDRSFMMRRVTSVQGRITRMRNNGKGLLDEISTEAKKIKRNVLSLDANIRSKFSFHGEYPPIEEILIAPTQPVCRVTPIEFVEEIATNIQGHVWTVACGIPEIGTIIKNNKTLESHAIPNIPLPSKLEVLMSITDYLEKIISHVESNLESSRKDIAAAKSLLKSRGKLITARGSKLRLLGMRRKAEDIVLSKREIKDHLISFAKILNSCSTAQEHAYQISDLLKKANDILHHVVLYIGLKFKLEPSVGTPNIGNDVLMRSQNWQTVDAITGVANPPNVPPPVLLKKIVRRSMKQETVQMKYKAAWEGRVSELETYFEQFCKRHIVVDIPIAIVPITTAGDGDEDNFEITG